MRQRVSTGFKYEDIAGYSRAIVDGDWIFMSGTVGMDYSAQTLSSDPAEQTEQALKNIVATLKECGATLENVLRLQVYITDPNDVEPICQVIGHYFRPYKPANTTVIAQLVDPRMKVEIEVTARRGSVD